MMFVILSYDVGEKRVGKISKIAKRFLNPVQRSLFQGYLNETQLSKLKHELMPCLDTDKDSVVFYKILNDYDMLVDEIGLSKASGTNIL